MCACAVPVTSRVDCVIVCVCAWGEGRGSTQTRIKKTTTLSYYMCIYILSCNFIRNLKTKNKNKTKTFFSSSVLKHDPNTSKVQNNAIY